LKFNKIFIVALIPLVLSIGIAPTFPFSEIDAELTQICIDKVWMENTKGKIACVTPSTATVLVERGWGTIIEELPEETTLETPSMRMQEAPFASISVMAFGPDNVLFIGDSRDSKIVAIELGDAVQNTESKSYGVFDLEEKIADYFNVEQSNIRIMDLKVHPQTKVAYLAVHVGFAQEKTSHILTVDVEGNLDEIDYSAYPSSSIDLVDPANEDIVFWGKTPARTLTVTDIDYHKGNIYVAGLSNEEFSSALRKIPYPFNGEYETSSIEMYHTTHNQMETRAPIRTQAIIELNGVDNVIAGYTCTPLVTIPVDSLNDGELVSGKTIAEIGYGNSPIDVLPFQSFSFSQEGGSEPIVEEFVLVTNTHRGAALFKVSDIEEFNQGEGLTTSGGFDPAGTKYRALPLVGLVHVDDQDEQFILGLQRDDETGDIDLKSFRKGMYFRLSEFINEYDFPSFKYPEGPDGEMMKGMQNMLISDEKLYDDYLH